jgi:hypothetical protein
MPEIEPLRPIGTDDPGQIVLFPPVTLNAVVVLMVIARFLAGPVQPALLTAATEIFPGVDPNVTLIEFVVLDPVELGGIVQI